MKRFLFIIIVSGVLISSCSKDADLSGVWQSSDNSFRLSKASGNVYDLKEIGACNAAVCSCQKLTYIPKDSILYCDQGLTLARFNPELRVLDLKVNSTYKIMTSVIDNSTIFEKK